MHTNTQSAYVFEIVLHPRPSGALAGVVWSDGMGDWPTLEVPRSTSGEPMTIVFDKAFERLGGLERMYTEPDGSFVWVGPGGGTQWQIDGNAAEKDSRVLLAELKGNCPPEALDRLLGAFGWPEQSVMMQLVRAGVFLDEETFRRHATARAAAGN